MAAQDPNKRIGTRVGPRTASEYTAEKGGLTPMRPSTLDAAYAQGNLTNPNPGGTLAANAAANPDPASLDSTFNPIGAPGSGAGGAAGDAFGQMFQNALPKKPQMMAKGGPMKIGQKPYLVGEEGPELIMPRQNGDGYVLPADVTQQLLPMMTQRPTPRAAGGPMTMESRGGTFRGFEGTSSSGQPAMGFASNIPTAMMTPDALARAQGDRVFVDPMEGRYQLDPNQIGMPMMPDVVTGPFAEPGMPAPPREQMRSQIGQSLESLNRMPGVRAAPTGRYPGQTFQDNAPQARYDNAMKLGQNDKAALAYSEQDPFNGASLNTSFEELRDRVALRGMMYGDDYRDRQNRDRTQLDLAARNARAPLGTPTMLPGQGSEARIAANLARERERLSRTPQGAQFLAQQQQEMDMLAQRSKLASTAIPVKDAAGNILGYTTGTGASLPNLNNRPRQVQRTVEVDGTMYNVYEDGSAAPISGLPTAAPKQQFIDSTTGRIVEFDADIDTSSLDPDQFKPVSRKPTPATPGTATAGTQPKPITSKAEYDALPAGATYTWNGQTLTKKA